MAIKRVIAITLVIIIFIATGSCAIDSSSPDRDSRSDRESRRSRDDRSDRGERDRTGGDDDDRRAGSGRDSFGAGFWPDAAPDERTVERVLWEPNENDLGEGETIISVSPSGMHILTIDRSVLDVSSRFTSGIPNSMGRQVSHVSIYSLANGIFSVTTRISIDSREDIALNDTLAITHDDGVSWSEDETRILIAAGFFHVRQFLLNSHTDIFILDIARQTFENLTGRENPQVGLSEGGYHHFLPQWIDNDSIRYIRYELDSRDNWVTSLLKLELRRGSSELLADLSSDGRPATVFDYAVHGDMVYFTRDATNRDASGFYAASMNGGRRSQTMLLDLQGLRERNIHPYAAGLYSVQVSFDGRWALLTVIDQRLIMRDVPFADAPGLPQPDPRSAVSPITNHEWIPCHNVILYDLENSRIADPFVAEALVPYTSIVTGATFSPDGKSLLCAVLGDGGVWLTGSFYGEATLYQVRIDDESFDAIKIFWTALYDPLPESLSWLGNNSVLIRSFGGMPPINPVRLAIPAAFEWLMD